MMEDPVTASDGKNYDRANIVKYMAKQKVSPVTQSSFSSTQLFSNRLMKELIQDYLLLKQGKPPNNKPKILVNNDDGSKLRYHQAKFKATHNSCCSGKRRGLLDQLNSGVRLIEFDFHSVDFSISHKYRLGHNLPGSEVEHKFNNPSSIDLRDWLELVNSWTESFPNHAPLTLCFDLKDDMTDTDANFSASSLSLVRSQLNTYGCDYDSGNPPCFHDTLFAVFGRNKIFTPGEVEEYWKPLGQPQWPPVEALRGKLILVLSGDLGTRKAYCHDKGLRPNVTLSPIKSIVSNFGEFYYVIEVHKSQNKDTLWYWTGKYSTQTGSVEFLRHGMFDVGVTPAVAMNSRGIMVEVHKSEAKDNLWYWVGRFCPVTGEIEWLSHRKYDQGTTPAVALTEDGFVIEVHRSEAKPTLWFWVGRLVPQRPQDQKKRIKGELDIEFRGAHSIYAQGLNPAIAVNDQNFIVLVHEHFGIPNAFEYRIARFLRNGSELEWLSQAKSIQNIYGKSPRVQFVRGSDADNAVLLSYLPHSPAQGQQKHALFQIVHVGNGYELKMLPIDSPIVQSAFSTSSTNFSLSSLSMSNSLISQSSPREASKSLHWIQVYLGDSKYGANTLYYDTNTQKQKKIAYQQILFVETQSEPGNDLFGTIAEGFWFNACVANQKDSHGRVWLQSGKIVRYWHFDPKVIKKGDDFPPNFPATNYPFHPDYLSYCTRIGTFDDGQADTDPSFLDATILS